MMAAVHATAMINEIEFVDNITASEVERVGSSELLSKMFLKHGVDGKYLLTEGIL
jgi:hypothetical protein